jgi:hypothetical protein
MASKSFFDGAIKMYDVSETRLRFVSVVMAFSCYLSQVDCLCVDVTPPAPRSNGLACVNDAEYFQLVLLIKFLLTLLPSVGDSRPTVTKESKGRIGFSACKR